jgi:hypothetical protein
MTTESISIGCKHNYLTDMRCIAELVCVPRPPADSLFLVLASLWGRGTAARGSAPDPLHDIPLFSCLALKLSVLRTAKKALPRNSK